MFSFAGDTVADPFAGVGSTAAAAIGTGRNSISIEIDPHYVELARKRIRAVINAQRSAGAVEARLT